jgi:hypothetical protein
MKTMNSTRFGIGPVLYTELKRPSFTQLLLEVFQRKMMMMMMMMMIMKNTSEVKTVEIGLEIKI